MKLHTVEMPILIGDGGKRRAAAGGHHLESRGESVDAVAVAHPDRVALAGLPDMLEQGGSRLDLHQRPPEFPLVGGLDRAAQSLHHRLLAITDAEDRQAHIENGGGRLRRGRLMHRSRAAGEDEAGRIELAHRLRLASEKRPDLAIGPGLPHPPCDQLGHLAAEIEDQDAVGHSLALAIGDAVNISGTSEWTTTRRLVTGSGLRRYTTKR